MLNWHLFVFIFIILLSFCFFHFPLATRVKNAYFEKKKKLPCVGLEPGKELWEQVRCLYSALAPALGFYAAILRINTTYWKLTA